MRGNIIKEMKGPGKRGHIVAHDVCWAAQTGKHLLRTQNVSERNQKHFCVQDTKFVSATNVARGGQTGKHLCRQQCVRKQCVLVCQGLYDDTSMAKCND